MAEQAAHLVDRVLCRAPYRQWVLTLPWELARAVAFDADLCSRVFAIFADEVGRWQCGRARARGIASPQAGSILEIQRFADGMTLFVHGHLFIAVLELTWSDGCDWEWIWEIKGLGRRGASKSRLGAKAAIHRAIRKHGGEETS